MGPHYVCRSSNYSFFILKCPKNILKSWMSLNDNHRTLRMLLDTGGILDTLWLELQPKKRMIVTLICMMCVVNQVGFTRAIMVAIWEDLIRLDWIHTFDESCNSLAISRALETDHSQEVAIKVLPTWIRCMSNGL